MKYAKIVSGNVTIFNKLTTSPYKKSLFSAEQGFLLFVNSLDLCLGESNYVLMPYIRLNFIKPSFY